MSNEAPGTFTPMPGAAPLSRQVLAQARMETKLLLRNGEQVLLAVVIPLLALVGGIAVANREHFDLTRSAVDTFTPGVLALAVMSTSFTSLAIATGFERRYGVLKRLGSSPLPRHGLLLGKVGSLLVVELLQLTVLGTVATLMGWSPVLTVAGLFGAAAVALLGTAAFASLGLFLAGALRAEATLAVANLVYVLLAAGGALMVPTSVYGWFGPVLAMLPSGALGDGLRASFETGSFPVLPLLVLAGWTAAGTLLTMRTFKWE